jgi:hypothetical protein
MNDFLVSYLDTIDERLLEYLDEDDELSLDAVLKLRLYASSLLDGTLSPDHLAEDWADWFHLAPAFVLAYGTEELEKLGDATDILDTEEGQQGISLTPADRAYLVALEARLDMYPEFRPTKDEPGTLNWLGTPLMESGSP